MDKRRQDLETSASFKGICATQDYHRLPAGPTTLPWSQRLRHFTFLWYLMTMSTGGYAGLLAGQPHKFRGLFTIGKIVFIFDLVLFVTITSLQLYRFTRWPHDFVKALRNPAEVLFGPAIVLSLEGIIAGTQTFGGPTTGEWLNITVYVLYWIYVALAHLCSLAVYHYLFTAKRMTVHSMTPAWILPILSCALTGSLAGSIAGQAPYHRVPILVAGTTLQGLGFWLSIPILGVWFVHLMSDGLPKPATRPGMFVAASPAAYSAFAVIHMANSLPTDEPYFMQHSSAAETVRVVAVLFAMFAWCLSFWLFCVALVATVTATIDHGLSFHLTWYAFIFPNVGLAQATTAIGQSLASEGVLWVASAMTICLTATYVFVLVAHARAIWKRQILWPGMDEDAE